MSSTSFIRHTFATLTYVRDSSTEDTWAQVTKNFNRFIQRYRRLHNQNIQYIRAIESHKDGYPHIHVLIQHPAADLRITNRKYFDRRLYGQWKGLWPHGLSDFQVPRRKSVGQLRYILKYINKNATCKTVWKKILPASTPSGHTSETQTMTTSQSADNAATPWTTSDPSNQNTEELHPTHFFGIKLLSWSRHFDFGVFALPVQAPAAGNDTLI